VNECKPLDAGRLVSKTQRKDSTTAAAVAAAAAAAAAGHEGHVMDYRAAAPPAEVMKKNRVKNYPVCNIEAGALYKVVSLCRHFKECRWGSGHRVSSGIIGYHRVSSGIIGYRTTAYIDAATLFRSTCTLCAQAELKRLLHMTVYRCGESARVQCTQ
jgi:hypothetical protein